MKRIVEEAPRLVLVLTIRGGQASEVVEECGVLVYRVSLPDPTFKKKRLRSFWRWLRLTSEIKGCSEKRLPVVMTVHKVNKFLIWLQLKTVRFLERLGYEVIVFVPVESVVEASRQLMTWRKDRPSSLHVGPAALRALHLFADDSRG